jgi:hypothetical protein
MIDLDEQRKSIKTELSLTRRFLNGSDGGRLYRYGRHTSN